VTSRRPNRTYGSIDAAQDVNQAGEDHRGVDDDHIVVRNVYFFFPEFVIATVAAPRERLRPSSPTVRCAALVFSRQFHSALLHHLLL